MRCGSLGSFDCVRTSRRRRRTPWRQCARFIPARLRNPRRSQIPTLRKPRRLGHPEALVSVAVLFGGLDYRDHAAVGRLADYVLELDGGVVDTEVVQETFFHVAQNALADRRRDILNRDMAGERVRL